MALYQFSCTNVTKVANHQSWRWWSIVRLGTGGVKRLRRCTEKLHRLKSQYLIFVNVLDFLNDLKVMRISSVNSDAAHLDHQQIVPGTSWSRRGLSIVQFCLSDFSAWFDIPTSAGQISDWVSLFPSKPFLFSHFLLILQSVLECCQCWHRQPARRWQKSWQTV